ncbi:unnamed protein product, partial [marine sediment metagenome]
HCPTPGGACTTGWPGCDEDSAFYIVNFLFTKTLDIKDQHITDPEQDYNLQAQLVDAFAYEVLTFTVIRDFDMSFSYTVDSSDPDQQTPPVTDKCVASPLFPCKTLSSGTVAGLGSFAGDMPMAAQMSITADMPGDFAWMSSAPQASPACPLFGGVGCPGITNAAKVGNIDFSIRLGVLGGVCTDNEVTDKPDLYDACMPPPSYTSYIGFGAMQDYVPETGCEVDTPTAAAALEPGPIRQSAEYDAGNSELSWASHLDP